MTPVAPEPGTMSETPKSGAIKEPDIVSASLPETLAALHVTPDKGLSHGEVDTRRKEHGYNEVVEQNTHPFLPSLCFS